MNLYRFCHNDPVNRSDPTGLDFFDIPATRVESIEGDNKFGNTEFKSQTLTVTQRNGDGTYSIRVSKFNVWVTKKEIATKDRGRPRTESAIEATEKKHEPLHVEHARNFHDANQHTVIRSELEHVPTARELHDAAKQMNQKFSNFGRRDQQDCRRGAGEWKPIVAKELSRQ
jgi:hypothetical protein